jgi:hypothetical protein
LHKYLQEWQWPKGYASGGNVLLKGRLHGSASDYVSFAPVFSKWLVALQRSGALPDIVAEVDSALALCAVVDELMLSKRGLGTPERLDVAIYTHSNLHQRAYGTTLWKWKNNAALHLGDMFRRHGILIPCFLHERKHKVVKRHAAPRLTMTHFSAGVLEEVTMHQLHSLQTLRVTQSDLVDPRPAPKKMAAVVLDALTLPPLGAVVETSRFVRHNGRTIANGDVALMQNADGTGLSVARVWFHCRVGDHTISCISIWPAIELMHSSRRVRVEDEPSLVPSLQLEESCIYSVTNNGIEAVVILPPHLR